MTPLFTHTHTHTLRIQTARPGHFPVHCYLHLRLVQTSKTSEETAVSPGKHTIQSRFGRRRRVSGQTRPKGGGRTPAPCLLVKGQGAKAFLPANVLHIACQAPAETGTPPDASTRCKLQRAERHGGNGRESVRLLALVRRSSPRCCSVSSAATSHSLLPPLVRRL